MADPKTTETEKGLFFEYFVPINSSATIDEDFTIDGIAINETTTSNGHKFIGEELSKAAGSLIGVPILKDHSNLVDSIVGKVNTAHWDESIRNIPFKAVIKDNKMKQLIKDKLVNSVSVVAHVKPEDIEEAENGDIIPHNIQFKELSLVAIPADGGATFGNAFNEAYKSYSTNVGISTERRDNMTEEEKTETETETKVEEPKEEPKVEELGTKAEEAFLRGIKEGRKMALKEADTDEPKVVVREPETKEEPKEEPKKEVPEEKEESEDEEEESEEVEEKGDYKFTEGRKSIGIERKSYIYN